MNRYDRRMEGESNISYPATAVKPHVAVCPSAGMGHLAPFLALASTLSSAAHGCQVTVVVIVPLVTAAESAELSSFFSRHSHILRLDFHVDLPTAKADADPFFLRYDSISQSAHRLAGRLSALTPPISAAFTDLFLTEGLNAAPAHYNNYTLITTSARFLSLVAYLPCLVPAQLQRAVEVPGLHDPFTAQYIPPPFSHPDHIFTNLIVSNARSLRLSKGVLVNTVDSLEPETISSIESGRALAGLLPPIFPLGPLESVVVEEGVDTLIPWLDKQPQRSVIYVSFGNRTTLSREQTRELGTGLERSGYKFIWVVKTSMVDKEEKAEESLEDILGGELKDKVCRKGKVLMRWVSQRQILGHKAVGGFVSHCGWNSVMEAARHGVPVLAWPQHGDQMENARVVDKAGLGVWERGWGGEMVGAAEIAEKVAFFMGNRDLRRTAAWVRDDAAEKASLASSMAALIADIQSRGSGLHLGAL